MRLIKLLPKRYIEYMKMESLKLPTFLNTQEKYNKVVRKTDTVKKYEELFYKLLLDESVPLLDILQLMKSIECDVILVHGIEDVSHLLDLTESFIHYMIAMTEELEKQKKKEWLAAKAEEEKQKTKQDVKKQESQSKSDEGEGYMTCDCDRLHNESGINTC